MKEAETIAIKKPGLHWLGLPPINFDAAVSSMSSEEKQELGRWLDSVCERAALLSGYLDARGAAGCGDNGHADGVQQAGCKLIRVRKALGFTYPNRGGVNF